MVTMPLKFVASIVRTSTRSFRLFLDSVREPKKIIKRKWRRPPGRMAYYNRLLGSSPITRRRRLTWVEFDCREADLKIVDYKDEELQL